MIGRYGLRYPGTGHGIGSQGVQEGPCTVTLSLSVLESWPRNSKYILMVSDRDKSSVYAVRPSQLMFCARVVLQCQGRPGYETVLIYRSDWLSLAWEGDNRGQDTLST